MMYEELIGELHSVASGVQSKRRRELLEKAADVIEEVSHDYEKLAEDFNGAVELLHKREKPRWIPVTERLPKIGQRILAVGRYGKAMYTATYSGGIKETAYRKANPYKVITGEYGWRTFTYWMPLPEPPKEETE